MSSVVAIEVIGRQGITPTPVGERRYGLPVAPFPPPSPERAAVDRLGRQARR